MCRDNLQVDAAEDSTIPHLNKTTSIVVNEAFKVKNNQGHSKADPSKQGSSSMNYRFIVGQSHQNVSKRSTGGDTNYSLRQSRDKNNVIASVKDSLDSMNTAKKQMKI